MPNHCTNNLRVDGDEKSLADFKKKTKGRVDGKEQDVSFQALVPMPDELEGTTMPTDKDDKEAEKRREKHGAANWYEWHIQNWGTKWDCYDLDILTDEKDVLTVIFNTAWAPPIPWLVAVTKLYPKLRFTLEYEEGGMAFEGVATGFGGSVEDKYTETHYPS